MKRLVDAYPLVPEQDSKNKIDVQRVLKYRSYIKKLPIFIKLIDFTNHNDIAMCYEAFNQPNKIVMKAEEALALVGGQFGDLRVRIFAIRKLSLLKDSQIALFMP